MIRSYVAWNMLNILMMVFRSVYHSPAAASEILVVLSNTHAGSTVVHHSALVYLDVPRPVLVAMQMDDD